MGIVLPTLPGELAFENDPVSWNVEHDAVLSITAGGRTDWFFDPSGSGQVDNAPAALFHTSAENFILSARVQVGFTSTFDAGVLQIRSQPDRWGKICFEYSPQKQPMIVSVVTRGRSDDCNSVPISGNTVYLRAARIGEAFAFHYSEDERLWNLVRHFELGKVDNLRVGFSAQSPTGEGCSVRFSEVVYEPTRLADIRDGS